MKPVLYLLLVLFLLLGSARLPMSTSAYANASAPDSRDTAKAAGARAQTGHTISVVPRGPSQETVDSVKAGMLKQPAVQKYLKGAEYRVLSFVLQDEDDKSLRDVPPPTRYLATVFDYTNNRAIEVSSRFNHSDLKVTEISAQPDPDDGEFQEAIQILEKEPTFGPALLKPSLQAYRPMPPLVNSASPISKCERTVAVGLMSLDGSRSNEIVGVNMLRRTVARFGGSAPAASIASPDAVCGPPGSGQSTTPRGTAGQYDVIVSFEGVETWRFTVVRPSVSSGTRASSIEIQNVSYRGKRVLRRAHCPILNVQYERNLCGPYRDWSYQEDSFTANGVDLAPGIRLCTEAPQTILESGNDTGNFRGVAIYDQREQVTLVTELQAGWYRYLSEWTFQNNGIIRPRYGFGTTSNSCVCNDHIHHVYWRLDFDIVTPENNSVFERFKGPEKPILSESFRPRLYGPAQTWRIANMVSGESATIIPGYHDGNFDRYGRFDLALLAYRSTELDDGINCTQGCSTEASLSSFVNDESLDSTDLVVWYAAHFFHIDNDSSSVGRTLIGPHVLGPDIVLAYGQ
jgi:hypothetical protein